MVLIKTEKIGERNWGRRGRNRDEWKTSEEVYDPPWAVESMMIMMMMMMLMSTWHIPCPRIKRICNGGSMMISPLAIF